ncbi:hypothetical protein EDM21_03675 [Paenibacillus sp. N10]|uniref:NodB homology domain-containing protein n=2 Tax=Paenibacillus lutrae TaxID=2078573 RepID=A0A7X3JY54_9BACL|nr:hypothetical protein [Paenibacillus lutrae]
MMGRLAKIGVWFQEDSAMKRWQVGQNVFERYLEEILAHAGIPFELLGNWEALEAYAPDVLLVAHSDEHDRTLAKLRGFVEQGGTLISYAGLNRLAGSLGCKESAWREAVYADIPDTGTSADGIRLRALGAKPWQPIDSKESEPKHQSRGLLHKEHKDGEEAGPAYIEFAIGSGRLIRWNVNIPETVVMLQQGSTPVTSDGLPAPDGTGNLDEGILKADDRCELDWVLDRCATETGAAYYGVPYADLWREVLLAQLIREAAALGFPAAILDYWPEGIRQVAMISHDSDLNIDESAMITMDVLKEFGVKSTWCMIEPGYSKEVYDRIHAEGHELAFHFNALEKEKGVWSAEEFERQLAFIRSSTQAPVVSNKNHYTRYEGWGDLYRWCEAGGIESDQTRGPSKKGNIGFPFGTCHPYYPVAWADERNRMYNVLEIGFLTQDLDHATLADHSVIHPFLEQVSRVRGVAHFLFHQVHILQQPKVREALRQVINEAQKREFRFWTGEQITRWEQSRREARMRVDAEGNLSLESLPPGAVIRVSLLESGSAGGAGVERRFGYDFRLHTVQGSLHAETQS